LYDFCDETGKSFASVVLGPLVAKVKPRKPPQLSPWPPETYKWNYATLTEGIDEAAE